MISEWNEMYDAPDSGAPQSESRRTIGVSSMIFDSLSNADCYRTLHPLFGECFDFLASHALADLASGRHELGDGGAYASVNKYLTKTIPEGVIECHRRFIDIQCIAEGEERIGVAPRLLCTASGYDQSRDFEKLDGRVDFILLKPGLFAVFFPDDGHMPGISPEQSALTVKKIVIKVSVTVDR
jgi:biofilm protein TabA